MIWCLPTAIQIGRYIGCAKIVMEKLDKNSDEKFVSINNTSWHQNPLDWSYSCDTQYIKHADYVFGKRNMYKDISPGIALAYNSGLVGGEHLTISCTRYICICHWTGHRSRQFCSRIRWCWWKGTQFLNHCSLFGFFGRSILSFVIW